MKRVALFAHYDAEGRVRRYVRHFIEQLRTVCDEVHFVSTAALPDAELASLRVSCARAYLRPNQGYDFGMWQDALGGVALDEIDELVLTNSSIFGPVGSLAALFARMASVDADVWGATENWDEAHHLQSYFLVFRRPVLASEAFRRFWNAVLLYRDKQQVIWSYEVGLSRFLEEQGFRLVPAVSFDRLFSVDIVVDERPRSPWMVPIYAAAGNPTCRFPVELVRAGLPFVKVETLRDNPFKVKLDRVYAAMREAGYDTSMVEFDRPRKRR
jgi:lipopolysaccharide biosynthesis protein